MSSYSPINATYTKENGEVSDRCLIVMSKPEANVKALDVSQLTDEKRAELAAFLEQQKTDLAAKMKELGVAWKSFKPEGLKTAA